MAAQRKKAPKKQQAPAPVAVQPGRDIRPYVYVGLDQLFAVTYLFVIVYVIPNRLASAAAHLWALPILMQLVALGAATIFVRAPEAKRIGWRVAIGAASLLLVVTVVLIVRVVISAAFLAGVYGAFGKAAALSALIGVALLVELVALLPLFQIKYLRTRAGRRAYAIA